MAAVLGLAPPAAQAGPLGSSGRGPGSKAFYDSRAGASSAGVHASARIVRARASLVRSLGSRAALTVDPLTGTPRSLERLSGALTRAARGNRTKIALRYARAHAAALGLTGADLDRLRLVERTVSPDGVLHLRWQQSDRGIPLFDNDLRVNVDRDGRIVNVLGSPLHDPAVASIDPLISPLDALHRVMDGAGGRVPASVVSGPRGAQRVTSFGGANGARLVLFTTAGGVRLAWRVVYAAGPFATWAAVIDARTGALLYRVNLTKADVAPTALVWENYPGAPAGGDPQSQNLASLGYLSSGADTLNGPNAHAWSDLNADGQVTGATSTLPDEEIHSHLGGNFEYGFTTFAPQPIPLTDEDPPLCPSNFECAWDPETPNSWQANRRQEAVQAFYYANEFHNHLESPPIGFTEADGAFDSGSAQPDPVDVETDVGIGLGGGGSAFTDNGSMTVNPDGESPVMQLYMFSYAPDSPFRDIAGGDDAATVYHEYTHGLSGRLITGADGIEALNTVQAGALSEAFSDWYAEDYLVDRGLETDIPNHPGDIDIGRYSDYGAHTTRTQAADCTVGASAVACPGGQSGHTGGYKYSDFGKIVGHTEVHADGEIFLETMWDIRTAVGSSDAEALITGAMRLVPPEPSFLDMRNAILAEDSLLYHGAHTTQLWSIFASRGMGFYAATTSSDDFTPVADFHVPPASGATGNVAGTVTDADTGQPLAGASVGVAGHVTSTVALGAIRTFTAANGSYHLNGLPAAHYPELIASTSRVYDPVTLGVTVSAGATTPASFGLHRDWAGSVGGGSALANDPLLASMGCGPDKAIDQHQSIGWSAYNPTGPDYPSGLGGGSPTLTVELQAHVDVSSFAIDPSAICSDDASAGTRDFRIETSSDDGHTYTCSVATVALPGCPAPVAPLSAAAAHKHNLIAPRAGARNVDFVRITLLHPLGAAVGQSGRDFIDLAELGVYGRSPDVPPSGQLLVDPNPTNIQLKTSFDASSFSDPDSAIVGYRWDYDGNGVTDRTTVGPKSSFTYTHKHLYAATVTAIDARGGQGSASAPVSVGNAPAPTLSVRALTGARVRVTVKCGLACSLRGTLTVSKAIARRAHISTTLDKRSLSVLRAGHGSVTLRIGAHTRRKLLHAGIHRVKVTVLASARDARDRARRKTTHPTLKP